MMDPKQVILEVLIVDDEAELRKSLASVLQSQFPDYSLRVQEAENGRQALEILAEKDYDLVFLDVRMPEVSGLEALAKIKEASPETIVLIMTAHSNLQDAILAIKNGAYDYIEKPVQPQKIQEVLRKALEARELVSSLAISRPILDDDVDTEFVGSSSKMRAVFQLIHRLSQVDTTVLIRGENGTGKELVAKAIHFNSPRKSGEFLALNCGAIPESLMESELFGHEKGAFTGASERKIGKFQSANNGTLFLDEIGELKPDMQVKLLRVLQERKFMPVGSNREVKTNARIIAATNRNLEKMIESGQFREDLFYRLNVMPIFMPPLRERVDDIRDLVSYFIKKFSKTHPVGVESISEEAIDVLKKYHWPGNIRELENTIERCFIVEQGPVIRISSLPEALISKAEAQVQVQPQYKGPLDFDRFREEAEKDFIVQALKANHGKINKTVAEANIPKNTLLRKIKKYGIDVKKYIDET